MLQTTHSADETIEAGRSFAKNLRPGTVVCMHGDLGAGKTTFIKGVIAELGLAELDEIQSPTFTYVTPFSNKGQTLYHFDLYRLENVDTFLSMGFEELLFSDGISLVEWAERIEEILPPDALHLFFTHTAKGDRTIEWKQER